MAGGMGAAIARNLAAEPHVAEAVLQRALDGVGELSIRDFVEFF